MANTLTNLQPDLYEALDVVSRELVGFIPSVTLDASVARAAVGQTVRSPVAPAATATDVTPGVTPPDDGDNVFTNKTITISKSRRVPVRWNGEEQRGVNTGPGYRNLLQDQFAQAMRTLTNEIEADLAGLYVKASRAYGTAGTTPFASDLSDTAQVRKILADNGAPLTNMRLVIDSTAGAKMRTLTQLTKANEAADASLLRQGVLLDVHGMQIRESAENDLHTKGTASGATTDSAGYAVGDTVITLASAGTGTIVAGDVITFAGDSNKYLVTTGDADVSNGGTITLAAPGLQSAIAASPTAITVGGNYTANMAFSQSAIVLAARVPARPEEGDQADDVMMITDPRSGMSFEVALYKQYRQISYEISAAWGFEMIKPEHTAILLG
jgi:hypothetical protein